MLNMCWISLGSSVPTKCCSSLRTNRARPCCGPRGTENRITSTWLCPCVCCDPMQHNQREPSDNMPNTPGKRVLIVDDNKSIRTMVRDYLGGRGYEVIEASDGIKGLDSALSSDADVIILDVVMPGMDGVRLCELLRDKG